MSADRDASSRSAAAAGDSVAAAAVERRFERVLDHLNAMLLEFDAEGRVVYVSSNVSEILGYAPEEIRSLSRFEWVHAEDVAEILALSRKLAKTGESADAIYRARHKQGRWLWLEMSASSFVMGDDSVRTLAFVRDVTQARQAGRALRITEDRFSTMAENAADLIGELDGSGRFVYVSPNCETLLGVPAETYVGQSLDAPAILQRLHPEDIGVLDQIAALPLASGVEAQIEYRFLHGDGSWRSFETRGRSYRTQGGELRVLIISRDITERVRAQTQLRESQERYRVLAETTHDLVIELDSEGRIVYVSPTSQAMLGYAPSEMKGTLPFTLIHPDDVERLAAAFLVRAGSSEPRHGGTVFRLRHRDGSWRWLEGGGVNYRTARGETRVVAVVRDVTEQRRAEDDRRRLEEWIRQAQKFESLGLMAGGIAHDFNNLLTPILGEASLALMDLPPDSAARARLERIQKAAQRAASLTHQLLDYAGRGALSTEPVDLAKLVREMGDLLATSVSAKAELHHALPEGLPPIEGDGAQISQVVMNLITNAAEAIGAGGGRIEIRAGALAMTRAQLDALLLGEGLAEGRYVYVEVEDSGSGMSAATRARIFDPFFTTKFTGRGLGLAAVLGIVRAHHGAIEIESEPGRGTRFRALFPASARGERAASAAPGAEPAATAGRGLVLVVDDEPGVLEVISETLTRAGYDVLRAVDGESALAIFREHMDAIRIVLLDLNMPGASGEDVCDEIRRLRPETKIVLISGYSQERSPARASRPWIAGFLQKPFLPATLLATVRSLLDT